MRPLTTPVTLTNHAVLQCPSSLTHSVVTRWTHVYLTYVFVIYIIPGLASSCYDTDMEESRVSVYDQFFSVASRCMMEKPLKTSVATNSSQARVLLSSIAHHAVDTFQDIASIHSTEITHKARTRLRTKHASDHESTNLSATQAPTTLFPPGAQISHRSLARPMPHPHPHPSSTTNATHRTNRAAHRTAKTTHEVDI